MTQSLSQNKPMAFISPLTHSSAVSHADLPLVPKLEGKDGKKSADLLSLSARYPEPTLRHRVINFMQRQLRQIYQGGVLVFVKKIMKLLAMIPHIVVAMPAAVIIRFIRPFIIIRVGKLPADRIGCLAALFELYLCERDAGMHDPKTHDIFYILPPVCNNQLKKMCQRLVHISSFAYSLSLANRCLPGCREHILSSLPKRDKDDHGLLRRTCVHFTFTPDEIRLGEKGLKEIGIAENAPIVCFMGRDPAYLNGYQPDRNWDYHNYRDMDIRNFVPAVDELTQRGYYAVRLGYMVKTSLVMDNPKFIDYATQHRTDFLDMYLAAKCHFFINSMAGFDAVPTFLFRQPLVRINFIPLEGIRSGAKETLYLPKKLWLKQERRFLTFREIFGSEVCRYCLTEQYERAGIEPIENTPQEITSVVLEMEERLKGTWQTNKGDEELQQRFWELAKLCDINMKSEGDSQTRIGAEFLRQNQALLDQKSLHGKGHFINL